MDGCVHAYETKEHVEAREQLYGANALLHSSMGLEIKAQVIGLRRPAELPAPSYKLYHSDSCEGYTVHMKVGGRWF